MMLLIFFLINSRTLRNLEVRTIEEYRYKNAVIRIRGEVRRDEIEKAAIIFMKKYLQRKGKENGNANKTRTIKNT